MSKKVLVAYGSPKRIEESTSSQLGRHLLTHLAADNEVKEVHIHSLPAFYLTDTILSEQPTSEDMKKLAIRDEILADFVSADIIIFTAPLWDFSIPGRAKEYLDAACVSGVTFKQTPTENQKGEIMEGLLEDKKGIFLQSMGALHVGSEEDLSEVLVRKIFSFIGIDDYTYIAAEGVDLEGKSTFDQALTSIEKLAKKL